MASLPLPQPGAAVAAADHENANRAQPRGDDDAVVDGEYAASPDIDVAGGRSDDDDDDGGAPVMDAAASGAVVALPPVTTDVGAFIRLLLVSSRVEEPDPLNVWCTWCVVDASFAAVLVHRVPLAHPACTHHVNAVFQTLYPEGTVDRRECKSAIKKCHQFL